MSEKYKSAWNIVTKIEADIQDRKGIGNEWDSIDEDIQEEIKSAWVEIITEEQDAEIAKLKGKVERLNQERKEIMTILLEGIGGQTIFGNFPTQVVRFAVKEYAAARKELAWETQHSIELKEELGEKQKYILQLERANLSTLCAYCGEFFEADADGRSVVAIQEHMKVCEKHPMRGMEMKLEEFIDLVSRCAPVQWAQARYIEDAKRWEQEAYLLLHPEEGPTIE